MRKAFWKAGIAAAVAVVSVGGAVTATAAGAEAGEQCVLNIDDGKETCFSSPAEAGSYRSADGVAFHIHVRLYPRTGYDGEPYLIGSFVKEKCSDRTDVPDYKIADLGHRSNWAGSFTTHNNCDIKGYDGVGFTGDHFADYRDHDIRLTGFNDRISSLKVS